MIKWENKTGFDDEKGKSDEIGADERAFSDLSSVSNPAKKPALKGSLVKSAENEESFNLKTDFAGDYDCGLPRPALKSSFSAAAVPLGEVPAVHEDIYHGRRVYEDERSSGLPRPALKSSSDPAADTGMLVICAVCGGENVRSDDIRFCRQCGQPLYIECPVCGEKNERSDEIRFCLSCGSPLYADRISEFSEPSYNAAAVSESVRPGIGKEIFGILVSVFLAASPFIKMFSMNDVKDFLSVLGLNIDMSFSFCTLSESLKKITRMSSYFTEMSDVSDSLDTFIVIFSVIFGAAALFLLTAFYRLFKGYDSINISKFWGCLAIISIVEFCANLGLLMVMSYSISAALSEIATGYPDLTEPLFYVIEITAFIMFAVSLMNRKKYRAAAVNYRA